MVAGPPWMAAILETTPRAQWPEDLKELLRDDRYGSDGKGGESFQTWDSQFGDRRTELVCIGRSLDHTAAMEQLEECLLTATEMAAGKRRWLALKDPYADPKEQQKVERDLRLSDGLLAVVLTPSTRPVDY